MTKLDTARRIVKAEKDEKMKVTKMEACATVIQKRLLVERNYQNFEEEVHGAESKSHYSYIYK